MNYHALAEQVKQYSRAFFEAPDNQHLPYHNLVHTESVVKAAIQTGNHYQLEDADFFVVFTAAWFHDIGYFSENANDHEKKGRKKRSCF